ncbi:TetR/AcrR family transcriptional regulator [Paenibacillus sp. J22TS3]|uniref:TetR/AcrR family transcriptional regulator n=1 Tax=Paenibacillus sp. J22TS3 TaxID=2807192 RepID=UPI001B0DFDF1|nr:TetR/AcrR family transcriptional regulator [Paenibacillus sp. J22TS3]GIP23858.1 HTH-type transcriptional regulator PksA [Paenibacillus sp. J22TS3]
MPKIVDHDKQRQLVAEAAIRVIRRSGLEQATVRNVAVEAGLSVGSMRHYFSTQAELFAFCMTLFRERIERRVEMMSFSGPVLLEVRNLILQFIPVDEERKTEMEVWLSFNAKALIHPELRLLSQEMHDGLYKASSIVIETLRQHKLARPDLDPEIETEKLYALIDGLALHQIMQPGRLSSERIEHMIDEHLRMLCGR